MRPITLSRLLFACVTLLPLLACAVGSANHGFSFGDSGENQGIEILNWRYGDSKLPFTHPTIQELTSGHIEQGWNATGSFPVADNLYVKWKVESTGKLYEETVNLKSLLPVEMDDKIVHFLIKDSKLYVYLIEGITSKQLHAHAAPDCPLTVYAPFQCSLIYPDRWSNF